MDERVSAIDALPAATRGTASGSDWFAIPRLAGVLLWRHWPALLFWFFAQRIAYDLCMGLAIALAERSALLSYAAIALLIVTQLVGTIGMFLALRSSLALPAHGGAIGEPARAYQPWVTALAVALLPFFAFYAGWGLLEGIQRDFRTAYFVSVSFDNRENLADILRLHGLWIALAVAWAVRALAKRRHVRTGRPLWSVVATACEAYWVFVGVAAVAALYGAVRTWWHSRVVTVAATQWWEAPTLAGVSLAPAKSLFEPAWAFLTTAAGAMLMPLVWLAIAALIYGLDLRRQQRLDAADARLRHAVRRYARLHAGWRILADRASAGWNSKGVPLVNGVRLVLRAGLPSLLTLCLGWQLLAYLDATLWLALVRWVGARSHADWEILGQPLSVLFGNPRMVRAGLVTEVLRVVLLAATFSVAVSRLSRPPRAA
jgi:hypothetical protein